MCVPGFHERVTKKILDLSAKIGDLNKSLSLRTKLILGSLVITGLSLILAITLLATHAQDYLHAQKRYESLQLYRQALIAANKISGERGPTNTVLGGDFEPGSPENERLLEFRRISDASLDGVEGLSAGTTNRELKATRLKLQQARQRVDSALQTPFVERDIRSIQAAVEGMFSALDSMRPLINAIALNSVDRHGLYVDEGLIGLKLLDLRDYPGQIGSILTPYIAKREAITPEDNAKLAEISGSIQLLWTLTKPYLERNPSLMQEIAATETIFFSDGLGIVAQLRREAQSGAFTFTTKTMTNAIVPTFAPLEALRVLYLDIMLQRSADVLAHTARWFAIVALMMVSLLVINLTLIIATQRMIFSPLLRARDDIVALSEERDLKSEIKISGLRGEVDEVFRAINNLRHKLLERQQLTLQLRHQASTDALTGLLNRRALDQIGETQAMADGNLGQGLILVDIDHFKRINDTHGHLIGDAVLKCMAEVLRNQVRRDDVVARFGGEEFAIIVGRADLNGVRSLGESLRHAISHHCMEIEDAKHLKMTASFGVAVDADGKGGWVDLVKRADAALYKAKAKGRNRVEVAASGRGDLAKLRRA